MTSERPILLPERGASHDRVLPFTIEGMDVRGRALRLGDAVEAALAAHRYPPALARLAAEALALVGLFGSMLEAGGILTLQIKAASAAPVDFLVADFAAPGDLRCYAGADFARLADLPEDAALPLLLGSGGTLALTLDPAGGGERYQGIVPLDGASLAEAAIGYFEASEQIPTRLALAAGRAPGSGRLRAGAVMIQTLARGEAGGPRLSLATEREDWNRAAILLGSVRREELLDPALALETLLFRLFHEEGVRVYEPLPLRHRCRCRRDRLAEVLASLPPAELADLVEQEGTIRTDCQFCGKTRDFTLEELASRASG